jgi:hypothetical protein
MTDSATKEFQVLDLTQNNYGLQDPSSSSLPNEAANNESEEMEEQIHLWNVIQTFEQYAPSAVSSYNHHV